MYLLKLLLFIKSKILGHDFTKIRDSARKPNPVVLFRASVRVDLVFFQREKDIEPDRQNIFNPYLTFAEKHSIFDDSHPDQCCYRHEFSELTRADTGFHRLILGKDSYVGKVTSTMIG